MSPQGKSPACLRRAPEGGPKAERVGAASNVLVPGQSKKLARARAVRRAEVDMLRKECAHLEPPEALQAVGTQQCKSVAQMMSGSNAMPTIL